MFIKPYIEDLHAAAKGTWHGLWAVFILYLFIFYG